MHGAAGHARAICAVKSFGLMRSCVNHCPVMCWRNRSSMHFARMWHMHARRFQGLQVKREPRADARVPRRTRPTHVETALQRASAVATPLVRASGCPAEVGRLVGGVTHGLPQEHLRLETGQRGGLLRSFQVAVRVATAGLGPPRELCKERAAHVT